MLDTSGRLIHLGDQVSIDGSMSGIVVFSIDTDEFSAEFPKVDWAYLGRGIMVQTATGGLVHFADNDELIAVIPAI